MTAGPGPDPRTTEGAFALLGLARSARVDDVVAARRRLAKLHHPDAGGDASTMQDVNRAVEVVLAVLAAGGATPLRHDAGVPTVVHADHPGWAGPVDRPSFTVEVLPVACFEALSVVATWIGEVVDEDPPYVLDVRLDPPHACWCRLEIVPDAGASSVSIVVSADGGGVVPSVDQVRDLWIDQLNRLDGAEFDTW